jgi:hypothetical protein
MLGLGGPVDARADLYSLAATFATLVGGRVPAGDEPGPVELPASVHPLFDVLRAMLSRRPEDRPADGRAVFQMLRSLGVDAPDETPATSRARLRHPACVPREWAETRILAEIPAVRGRWGPSAVVALKGPLGIGKSRLVLRLGIGWRSAGVRVFQARARDGQPEDRARVRGRRPFRPREP